MFQIRNCCRIALLVPLQASRRIRSLITQLRYTLVHEGPPKIVVIVECNLAKSVKCKREASQRHLCATTRTRGKVLKSTRFFCGASSCAQCGGGATVQRDAAGCVRLTWEKSSVAVAMCLVSVSVSCARQRERVSVKKYAFFLRCEQRGGVRRDAAGCGGIRRDALRLTRLRSDAVSVSMCLVSVSDSKSHASRAAGLVSGTRSRGNTPIATSSWQRCGRVDRPHRTQQRIGRHTRSIWRRSGRGSCCCYCKSVF